MSAHDRIKVAVIGGGCAAMSAAFELTRPELGGRFEVTVYQMGWRLGGKGASGRGPSGRIEEHGLHIWMGWYENAFRLMRDAYGELGRAPSQPLATWQDAFSPMERLGVVDRVGDDQWAIWTAVLPPMDGQPGDPLPEGQPWSVAHYITRSVQLLVALFQTLQDSDSSPNTASITAAQPASTDTLSRMLRYGELATLAGMIQGISVIGGLMQASSPVPQTLALEFLDAIAANARQLLEARLADDIMLRRIWQIIDVTVATLRGMLRFNLAADPRGFDAIDDYECRQWLRMNGASDSSLDSGYIRALYDLAFCYEDGDPQRPSMSAGQALRGTLRMFFTYRGAFFWRMNAGMGDVVFAPLYEVLIRRGVRFEFFHVLRNVRLGSDGSPHVEALELDVQARTRDGSAYRPLVDVQGLPCWPSRPDLSQLDGDGLGEHWEQLESWSATPVAARKELRVSRDFDFVVLGVGLGAIPQVCSELLAADPKWKAMTQNVKTVATQAFQLWLADDMRAWGWTGGPVALSGFVEPFDTWADMSHLLPREAWAEPAPQSIAYFCNVLSERQVRENSHDIVRTNAVQFLEQSIRHLWPQAGPAGQFPWQRLAPPGPSGATGRSRFDTQFWRANTEPTDRYVLSVPGSSRFRISPLDRTYDNLTIAGDWTACGFHAGCVEAAVMSGRVAAHALCGLPRLEDIIGFDHP
ncbi:MAG TPA: NAD(P)-binding protein [Candidatus Binatia bacterium]|nr:NAD(P)-binding protein [Candidatus Binatia bacterium]